VQDGRGIEPDVSSGRQAGDRAAPSYNRSYIRFGDAAKTMRPRSNQQRGVGRRNVVEVKTHRDHTRQQLEWRDDMKCAPLPRPGPKTFDIHPLGNGNHSILVPSKRPIGIGNLIEEDRPHRTRSITQDGGRQGSNRPVMIQKWLQANSAE
jgi:hypothetical protein